MDQCYIPTCDGVVVTEAISAREGTDAEATIAVWLCARHADALEDELVLLDADRTRRP